MEFLVIATILFFIVMISWNALHSEVEK